MFSQKGREPTLETKDAGKPASKLTVGDASGILSRPTALNALRPSPLPPLQSTQASPPPARVEAASAAATEQAHAAPSASETAGSKLFVGANIKLKGVEISDCDVLVIEGQVEATILSQAMQISKPGTLKGTATIDVAEVHGEFSGELTARKRLVVHGSGRVSGTIRYGQLIVAEGGEVCGDVQRLDGADARTGISAAPSVETAPAPAVVRNASGDTRHTTPHPRGSV